MEPAALIPFCSGMTAHSDGSRVYRAAISDRLLTDLEAFAAQGFRSIEYMPPVHAPPLSLYDDELLKLEAPRTEERRSESLTGNPAG